MKSSSRSPEVANFRNRIVGYEEVDPEQLLANPRNWRIHPQNQQEALEGVLEEVGWIDDIIVNQQTGFVVDGHLRVSLAISKGEAKVPVKYVDLTEEEELVVLATLDPIAAMAATDKDKLAEVFELIQSDNEQVNRLLDEIAKKERIEREVDEDPGAQIDRADELQEKWQVERGQVWQIGNHRLMCGDSTSEEDVGRLIVKEMATLCATSPPYFNQRPEYSIFESYEDYNHFLSLVLDRVLDVADEPFILAWNTGDNQADCLPMIADQTVLIHGLGLTYLDTIIWRKAGAVYSIPRSAHIRTHQCYYPALSWEPIIIFRKGSTMPKFDPADVDVISSYGINVWEMNQVVGSEQKKIGHPAVYPVELASRVIRAYSGKGSNVYDPFLGSGTTMVAAQQLNRICYGMEIEPKYCSVTLERMSEMGLEPVLHKTHKD